MSKVYNNFIGGQWVASATGKTIPVLNPANEEDVLGHCQASGAEDVDAAVRAAQAAFPAWKKTPAPKRGRIVRKVLELAEARVEELAQLMTREVGKLITEARGEIAKGNTLLDWFGGEGMRLMGITAPSELASNLLYTIRKPIGVAGIITPWNFPWALPCWKIAPALVAGNTVVFKPAEDTPLMGLRLAELFEEAGLPPGVLNVVTGLGHQTGEALVQHPEIKVLSFTGSTAVGRRINEVTANRLCKVSLELGGKNACVVLDDADLDLAAAGVFSGTFGSQGQRCTATSRLIVQEGIADALLQKLKEKAEALKLGAGVEAGTQMGPLVNRKQQGRVLDYLEIGKSEAKLVTGGSKPSGESFDRGCFVQPTIFDGVRPGMRIEQEEIFGPVLAVIRVKDYDEAVQIANGVEFGLSSAIYTRDINTAMRFIDDIDAGMVHINSPTVGGEAQVPFGGIKNSGLGDREMAKEGLHFFTEQVTVFLDYTGGARTSKIY